MCIWGFFISIAAYPHLARVDCKPAPYFFYYSWKYIPIPWDTLSRFIRFFSLFSTWAVFFFFFLLTYRLINPTSYISVRLSRSFSQKFFFCHRLILYVINFFFFLFNNHHSIGPFFFCVLFSFKYLFIVI